MTETEAVRAISERYLTSRDFHGHPVRVSRAFMRMARRLMNQQLTGGQKRLACGLSPCPFLALSVQQAQAKGRKARHEAKATIAVILPGDCAIRQRKATSGKDRRSRHEATCDLGFDRIFSSCSRLTRLTQVHRFD